MHRTEAPNAGPTNLHVYETTVIGSAFLNALQEELCYLIEHTGGTVLEEDSETWHQVYQAIFESGGIGDDAMDILTELNTLDDDVVSQYGGKGLTFTNGPYGTTGRIWRMGFLEPSLGGVSWSETYMDSGVYSWNASAITTTIPTTCKVYGVFAYVANAVYSYPMPCSMRLYDDGGYWAIASLYLYTGDASTPTITDLELCILYDAYNLDLT